MNQTMPARVATLQVPGASLYYEARGSGPVLLLMPGGPADAAVFRNVAGDLAQYYTVVTYDPRGLSHSKLEGPLDDEHLLGVLADDALRLLEATSQVPAYVFGNSGGAVVGLELVTRHPERVLALVAHEPPAPALLPEPARRRAEMDEIPEIYRRSGVGPAMQRFMAVAGLEGQAPPPPQGEPTPEMREAMVQMQRNMDVFLGHFFAAVAGYVPQFDRLKARSSRIVAAVGDESRGELANQGGLGLAAGLGTDAVVFPGGHGGFNSHPAEFAARLRQVLED